MRSSSIYKYKLKRALVLIVRRSSFVVLLFIIILGVMTSLLLTKYISKYTPTPIEKVISQSNQQLTEHHDRLHTEYQLLKVSANTLVERDANIYKQLFGIELGNTTAGSNKIELGDSLNSLSFAELVDILLSKTEPTIAKGDTVGKQLKACVDKVKKTPFRNIPTIQPVSNKNLAYNITPAGMRIEPYSKSMVLHTGIDYPLPEGIRVFATANGVVRSIHSESDGGGTVVINHANYYTTTYAYMSKINVKVGGRVTRGMYIGDSGNSGKSFLPHLHYEVRYKNRALDPMDFFFGELMPHQIREMRDESEPNIQSFE